MGDTTEDTPVKKIREIMKERGFSLHAHSPDYKWMDFTHQFDSTDPMTSTHIHCDVNWISSNESDVSFKFTYVVPKSLFFLTSNDFSPLFNDAHFDMWFNKFLQIWDKVTDYYERGKE